MLTKNITDKVVKVCLSVYQNVNCQCHISEKCSSVDILDRSAFWVSTITSMQYTNNHGKNLFPLRKKYFLAFHFGNRRNPKMVQNHHPNLDLPFSNLTNINIVFMLFIHICPF